MSKRVDEVRGIRRRDEILREEEARAARIQNTVIVALLVLTALYFCWLGWMKARQPVVERAAYLEGRWGLDHATAMVYARNILECP